MDSLEKRIRAARSYAGLTQIKLAEKTAISVRALKRYEKDAAAISLSVVLKMAHACSVDEIWLITGQGMMEKTDAPYEDSERCSAIAARLRDLEHNNPKVFDMVETYIAGVYEGVKVTLGEDEE